jgi:hypothetical protein
MGNRYTVSQENVTPTAGNDILTLVSATSRRLRIWEVQVSGRGTSSAAQSIEVSRSTGGTTPGGAATVNKTDHTDEPTNTFTTATTWAAQPSQDASRTVLGFNALGGANRAGSASSTRPYGLEARNGENISIRAATGITWQPISLSVVVEED